MKRFLALFAVLTLAASWRAVPQISIAAESLSDGTVRLSWNVVAEPELQSTTNLANPDWKPVSPTGQSTAYVAATQSREFFRVVATSGNGVASNAANLGFEADAGPAASPRGWTSIGDVESDSVIGGAHSGGYSLLHSNAIAYEVQSIVLITNLQNGIYSLNAHVKNSGGQGACFITANGKLTSLPPLHTNWTPTIVRGIRVTNGMCRVAVVSDANPGNWCQVDSIQLTRDGIAYDFLKGGDISELPRLEHYGGKFFDGGVEKDCLEILRDRGCNLARIRMYHDPGNPNHYPARLLDPLGWQNPARTLALAKRAKDAGMQIQLTFHYSDYWSNPGTQHKPHAWEGLSFSALSNALYVFTKDFMVQMKEQGTTPEFVSLGNEIRGGILFPDGANTNTAGWDRLANLLRAGHAAVKSVAPESQVVIHIDKVDAGNLNWFFGNLKSRNVPYDVIGCSYYPFWTGLTTTQARDEIQSWHGNYNKPVLIMETGYNWAPTTCNGSSGQLSNNGPEFFPSTPLGQKNFMLKLFNDLKLVTDGRCIGDIYWDPIFICVPGQGWQTGAPNVVANTALFDFAGHALPVFDAFQFNN